MSVVKHFIKETVKKTEINEFLKNKFERAGYGGCDLTKTPLGTHIVIYAMRPGIVIGRGGETIRSLATILEQQFQLPNPQISVAEIEIPEFNAHVMASRITAALKRGVHFRRAGFWSLNQIMKAGALGAEIIIRGKLRTERARYEKFQAGYIPKSGEPALKYVSKAVQHVLLKPGIFGVKVSIIPPHAQFPDRVQKIEEIVATTEENKAEISEPTEPKKADEKKVKIEEATDESAEEEKN